MMMKKMGMDPDSAALEELLAHLRSQDADEIKMAMEPPAPEGGASVEMLSVEGEPEGGTELSENGISEGEGGEDIEELIEALASKLGG